MALLSIRVPTAMPQISADETVDARGPPTEALNMVERYLRLSLGIALSACRPTPSISPLSAQAPVAAPPAAGPQAALVSSASAAAASKEVTRVLLSHEDLADLPGYESRLYLIEFPPGTASKAHIHPTPCLGYVLEGSFESSYDDGPVASTQEGESFVDRPHQTHHFRNPDPVRPLRFVLSGTFRKDQELFQLAQ